MTTVALVGCAHIHAPHFASRLLERTDIKVAAVWDHDAARATNYGTKLKAPVVSDVAQIWNDSSIQAAIICSETIHHPKLVAEGASAKKHLFVEKPLGTSAKEAQIMADAIKKAGVIFQTGFFRRGDHSSRTLKSLVSKGALGQVTRVRDTNMHHGLLGGWFDTDYRWMADTTQAGVGAFGDMGAHSVDFLIWLFGEVESVTGLISAFIHRYPNCDETGEALLKFKNGATGTIGAGWLDFGNPISTIVSGSKGFAYIRDGQLYLNSKDVTGKDDFQPYSEFTENLPHAFDLFLDAVGGKKDVPLVTVDEAAHGTAVVEAIYQGSAGQKWVRLG